MYKYTNSRYLLSTLHHHQLIGSWWVPEGRADEWGIQGIIFLRMQVAPLMINFFLLVWLYVGFPREEEKLKLKEASPVMVMDVKRLPAEQPSPQPDSFSPKAHVRHIGNRSWWACVRKMVSKWRRRWRGSCGMRRKL